MTRRKLVITHTIDHDHAEKVKSLVPDWDVIIGKEKKTWKPHLKDAEVIAGWKPEMNNVVAEPEANLRWVQAWSAGINGLPLDKLEGKETVITSANGVHAYPISETIFGHMLALTRKIHTYVKQQQTKTWHHANMNLELHEKTVGIIGVGAIGKETAKIAKAFEMTVLGVRNSGEPVENVDEMYTADSLHDLLPRCDYVVVSLPLTEKTHHLFGAKEFSLMKDTAFFVTIGRGQLVAETELITALKEGAIAGAGLDVFEKEPLEENNPLWELDNVIVTPHTAGSTEFYNKRVMEDIFIPNLESYVNGDTLPVNRVDYRKGY
ncbi:D-2-hydroxyacid dehydrogenase [Alteribacter keqinensis]|uniref:D-2-hydroxyacid dehydrogenase n=1 Tax=Alteribacter keqinensis TaxID=2483800 RepID=A0A3M7TMB2_9BACI|nr:D-2-hydroxyacid dehydrogenase [Alteribacter keqinensis]RNA66675.1 D-2-hydroxyacid dehydrogenase [Alteribacter keqinensis]